MNKVEKIIQILGLMVVLYVFFVSLELMGGSFKLMGRGFAETLLSTTANPFVGLFIGILATSLVQSSSTVTSLTVGIVAAGGLTVPNAIPIIMGANIGTSVTNTIVSLGHITRKDEFERAMAGATVHDFFNLTAVVLILPLELFFGVISKVAGVFSSGLAGAGGLKLLNPLKAITKPVSEAIIGVTQDNGVVVLILGILLLFAALRYLVVLLKSLFAGRSEGILHKYIFRSAVPAMVAGMLLTTMVQSSSVTTSVVVPMVGAGILTVAQIFPFTLGANIGTTVTALLAALAAGEEAGLTVALAHLIFNCYGIALIYPYEKLRRFPIWMAESLGKLAVKNRLYAFAYIAVIFFLFPLLLIALT